MKLLLVDDEEYAREGLVARIDWDSLGITEIMTARNGIDGLKKAGDFEPDIVVTDVRMPKMDGIELMQYLHENNPEIKIIILSGYNDVEYLNMAIRNQVTEYLLKPTDIDEFETLFHRLKEKLDEEGIRRRELESLKVSAM